MSHRINPVPNTIIGILAVLGACAGHATAQTPPAQPPKPTQLVVPPPNQPPAVQPETASTGKSQLVFEETEHDFGKIKDDAKVVHNFKFVNKGDGVLKFTSDPKPSCGCTAGKPRSAKNPDPNAIQMEFAPGEEGLIEVTYNPSGKHGDANQRVTLSTNDPQQPEQIIKIHAFVKTTIAFDPPLVSFGEVRAGEPAKQIVKVIGPTGDFKVTYASVTKGRFINVKVLDTKPATVDGEDVSQTTLEVSFNGTAPRGTLQAMSTIRTTNDKYPLADLQIMAEVVGDLQVLPPRVNVGIVDSGAQFSKMFKVSSRTGKAFKVTKTDQKTNLATPLTVNITPAEPGSESSYQVEVKGTAPTNAVPISATITLSTDSPSDKTLEVALNGAVRPQAPQTPPTPPSVPGVLRTDPSPVGPGATPPKAPESPK